MKYLPFITLLISLMAVGCDLIDSKTIKGNGNHTTIERNIANAKKIKSLGSFEVHIIHGTSTSIKIEADDNLMPYIITENDNGWLVLRTKDHVSFSSDNAIKIYVTTDMLEAVEVAGSSNVTGDGKFSGSDEMSLNIAGSGSLVLEVNTPKVKATIAGSGDITLSGETKNESIEIAGDGNYKAENLKAENADVHIAGSGNVKVFADNTLKIDIAGSGDIYYKGNATITKSIAGSGSIKQLP